VTVLKFKGHFGSLLFDKESKSSIGLSLSVLLGEIKCLFDLMQKPAWNVNKNLFGSFYNTVAKACLSAFLWYLIGVSSSAIHRDIAIANF